MVVVLVQAGSDQIPPSLKRVSPFNTTVEVAHGGENFIPTVYRGKGDCMVEVIKYLFSSSRDGVLMLLLHAVGKNK